MSTLTTRGSKGSELTHNELDDNFKCPVATLSLHRIRAT